MILRTCSSFLYIIFIVKPPSTPLLSHNLANITLSFLLLEYDLELLSFFNLHIVILFVPCRLFKQLNSFLLLIITHGHSLLLPNPPSILLSPPLVISVNVSVFWTPFASSLIPPSFSLFVLPFPPTPGPNSPFTALLLVYILLINSLCLVSHAAFSLFVHPTPSSPIPGPNLPFITFVFCLIDIWKFSSFLSSFLLFLLFSLFGSSSSHTPGPNLSFTAMLFYSLVDI